ncbi:hypothetical protein Tco_1028966 [Tanacetum coccineum]|uniref:Uncharacterized protein n=1 Tax=Tanacetum coccineum TaxID=301880 RepID=A0ABQ5G248_9ASTR
MDSPAEETETESNVWDDGSEDVNPFGRENPEFHDDHYDNPLSPLEEEERFVGKGGFGGEEDNIEDVVVVANDLCSSMIQTILSVDFDKDINTTSHELMLFGKNDQGSSSSRYKEREFDVGDANLDAASTRDK